MLNKTQAEDLAALINSELPEEYRAGVTGTLDPNRFFIGISLVKRYDDETGETKKIIGCCICTVNDLQEWENVLHFVHAVSKFEKSGYTIIK